MLSKNNNSCYTYFAIKGDFDPDEISNILQLTPSNSWRIGDTRRDGKTKYDFALWEYGRCTEYDVIVTNQMMKTIAELKSKILQLNEIRKNYDVSFVLEIVPEIYVDTISPVLNPNREIIEFCYLTNTDIDIDYYLFHE